MTAREAFEASATAVSRELGRWEIGIDGAIHAVAIVVSVAGAIILIVFAARHGGSGAVASVCIYCAGLITMLGCSAAYNIGQWTRHRVLLRNFDQAAIFFMIAGTYTPFTVLRLEGAWSVSFTGIVWTLAAGGALVRFLHGRIFDRISIALYLGLGWLSVVAIFPLVEAVGTTTLALLAIGGALYTIGIAFHLWQRLPFQTVIWHIFVVAAAAVHYAAVAVSVASAASAS
jgi:hemolysin III